MNKRIKQKWVLIGLSLISSMMSAPVLAQDSYTLQKMPGGTIDWMERWVESTGSGIAPQTGSQAQKRLMAERAAQADAYRQLAETVYGVQVDAETTVRDFVVASDLIRTRVDGVIKGARRQGQARYLSDGSVEMTLRMPLYGAKQLSGALGAQRLMQKRLDQLQPYLHSGVALKQIFAAAHRNMFPELPLGPTRLASAQPGFMPIHLAQNTAYTGLVLDMCTLPIQPAMSPAVMGGEEQVYIGNFPIDPDQIINEGVLQYYNDFDRAITSPRVGAHPLVIEAWESSANGVDVVVSPEDSKRISMADQSGQFLKNLKVVVSTL